MPPIYPPPDGTEQDSCRSSVSPPDRGWGTDLPMKWKPSVRAAGLGIAVAASILPASAQEKLPPPPPSSAVCPAIDEYGRLCTQDRWSRDCGAFVEVADRLGALYRSEREKLPSSGDSLLTTIWWGCGSATLSDVKRLLQQIGSKRALVVLKTEPYKSLPTATPVASGPPVVPAPSATCEDLSSPAEMRSCEATKLAAAQTAHRQAFQGCQHAVIQDLRPALDSAESSWEAMLPELCDASGESYDDADRAAYMRARCMLESTTERTQAMFAAHPECAPRE